MSNLLGRCPLGRKNCPYADSYCSDCIKHEKEEQKRKKAEQKRRCGMIDNKSLCDTCSHMFTCERSDVGISWANHSVCYEYAPVKNEEGGADND